MAKCPNCYRTFEPTREEEKNAAPFSINICSRSCWMALHKGVNPEGHRWEYHVGDAGQLPSKCGCQSGIVDYEKMKFPSRRNRNNQPKNKIIKLV